MTFTETNLTNRAKKLASRFGGSNAVILEGIPPKYTKWRLGDFPDEIQVAALDFLEQEVPSLYLHGTTGTGKTCLAAAILVLWRGAHVRGASTHTGIFLPAYQAAHTLRDLAGGDEDRRGWEATPFLVLDDVGAPRSTPYLKEQMLFLLEYRYDWTKQTIITSNLTLAEFADAVDPRAASRLQEGMVLDLGDVDRRGMEADHAETE